MTAVHKLFSAFQSLRVRIVAFILMLFLVAVWLVTYTFSSLLQRDLKQLLGEQQLSAASVLASHTSFEVESRLKALQKLAQRISPALMSNPAGLTRLLEERITLQSLLNGGYYVVNAQGTVIADVLHDNPRVGMYVGDRDWIKQAYAGRLRVGDPIRCRILKAPVFTLTVPIIDDKGAVTGVLAGVIDLSKPNFLDDIANSRYGKTGSYALISQTSRMVITASDKRRILEELPEAGKNSLVDRVVNGTEGSLVATDQQGSMVLASARKIPVADWSIVITLPVDEAFTSLWTLQHRITIAAITLSLVSCLLIWWLLHHHLTPVFNTIRHLRMLVQSEKTPELLPVHRKDEVGELLETFNSLLGQLSQREALLQETARNYHALANEKEVILRASPVGICLLQERTVIWSNPAFEKMFGYPAGATMGLNTAVFYPDHAAYEQAGRDAYPQITQGFPFTCIARMKKRDNTPIWCRLTGSLLRPDRPEDGSIWILLDITDQKRDEQQKQLIEKRLKAQLCLLQYQADTTQQFIDHALDEAIGITESTIGYIYLYDEETQEFILNSWSREVMSQCSVQNPQTRYHLDNTGIWGEAVRQRQPIVVNDFAADHDLKRGYPEGHVHLSSFLTVPVIRHGRIVAVVGVGNKEAAYDQTDILQLSLLMDTVWNHVEVRRADEEQKYLADIIERSLNEIYLFDQHTFKFLYANRGALCNLQYTLPEIMMLRAVDIKPNFDEAAFEKIVEPLLDNRTDQLVFETVHQRADGSQYQAEVNLQLVPHGNSKVFLAVINDISERKRVEEENTRMAEQLHHSQKLESIGRLAGGIAHDFNNMLMVILGNAELARFDLNNHQKTLEHLAEIRHAAEHSRDITAQLLAFSRQQIITPRLVDINEGISVLLKPLSRIIGENIQFSFFPGDRLWRTLIDPVQLDQIVMNMAINARDAMGSGGTFSVETRNVSLGDHRTMQGRGCIPGDYVQITFKDTGPGIADSVRHKIFEPFFTTKEVGKGTGLGLATIHGIVSQNQGYIEAGNHDRGGAVFTVYLPRHREPAEVRHRTADGPCPGSGTILLVEDEQALCKMTTLFLQNLGYTVHATESPIMALEMANDPQMALDLIITDVVMPEMNGKTLVDALKLSRPEMKVIYVSGYTTDTVLDGIMSGAEFVQKPYDLVEMSQRISQLLDAT